MQSYAHTFNIDDNRTTEQTSKESRGNQSGVRVRSACADQEECHNETGHEVDRIASKSLAEMWGVKRRQSNAEEEDGEWNDSLARRHSEFHGNLRDSYG